MIDIESYFSLDGTDCLVNNTYYCKERIEIDPGVKCKRHANFQKKVSRLYKQAHRVLWDFINLAWDKLLILLTHFQVDDFFQEFQDHGCLLLSIRLTTLLPVWYHQSVVRLTPLLGIWPHKPNLIVRATLFLVGKLWESPKKERLYKEWPRIHRHPIACILSLDPVDNNV